MDEIKITKVECKPRVIDMTDRKVRLNDGTLMTIEEFMKMQPVIIPLKLWSPPDELK